MAKGKKRRGAEIEKARRRAAKRAGMPNPSGQSKYGKKHAQQVRGNFAPTSPFEAGKPEEKPAMPAPKVESAAA